MVHIGNDVVDIILHDLQISGLYIQIVWNRHHQAVPGDSEALAVVGDHIVILNVIVDKGRAILRGKSRVLAAVRADRIHPLAHKGVGVRHIGSRQCIDLGVAGPAHTLISLRAVGRNGQIVAGRGVGNIGKQLVGQLVAGFVGGCRIQGGQNLHLDTFRRQLTLQTADLDVPISMEGQIRCKDISCFFHGIEIRHHGRTIVFHHQHAVHTGFCILGKLRIQNLCKTDRQGPARFCQLIRDRDHRNAGNILTHIVQVRAGAFFGLAQGFLHIDGTDHVYRFVIAGRKRKVRKLFSRLDHGGRLPGGSIISGCGPAFHRRFLRGIIAFSLEHGSQTDRTIVIIRPGSIIRHHGLCTAVCIGQHQLCQQRGLIAIVIVVQTLKGGHAGPPAFTKDSSHGILTGLYIVCHVIDIVGQDLIILGGSRVEPILRSDLLTVDIVVVNTLGRQIQTCRSHLRSSLKVCPEHGSCRIGGIGISQDTVFSAVHRDHIAVHGDSVQPFKDPIACAGFPIQQDSPGKASAVFDGILREGSPFSCIGRKTDTVQVGEGVSVGHGVDQDRILQFHLVHSDGQGAGCTEDIHMMRLILIVRIQNAVQILVFFDGKERDRRVISFVIAQTIGVDLHTAGL